MRVIEAALRADSDAVTSDLARSLRKAQAELAVAKEASDQRTKDMEAAALANAAAVQVRGWVGCLPQEIAANLGNSSIAGAEVHDMPGVAQ
jgi:hypothetical protein